MLMCLSFFMAAVTGDLGFDIWDREEEEVLGYWGAMATLNSLK